MIKQALTKTYQYKSSYVITLIVGLASLYLYFLAVLHTGSLQIFFNETPKPLLLAQIIFSILNSIFIGIVLAMVWVIFKEKKDQGNLTFVNALAALFLSVASTGCYVCGTVLLPVFGITASFAALPLGGLEIKILTLFLLIYSFNDAAKNVLGLCAIKKPKLYKINLGITTIKFSDKLLFNLRPILVAVIFTISIFLLPSIIPDSLKKEVSSNNVCQHELVNRKN